MRIERHILGSVSGYSTLAHSSAVSSEDCRNLESGARAFGQSNEASVRQLSREPSYFTRLLGGRRGLTRLLEGIPDDNGRPTVLLITVIVSQTEWDSILCGDVTPLLEAASLWQWDGAAALPPLEMSMAPNPQVPRKVVPKALALISELERSFAARRAVVVGSDDYGLAELRAIEMMLPPAIRPRVNTAYRSFSSSLPASVNCVAVDAAAVKASFHFRAGQPLSPYAAMLSEAGVATGILPLEQIAAYRQFGATHSATHSASHSAPPAPPAPPAPHAVAAGSAVAASVSAPAAVPAPVKAVKARRAAPMWVVGGLAAACVALGVAGFIAGNFAGRSSGESGGRAAQQKKIDKALGDQRVADDARMSKELGVRGTHEEMLAAAAKRIHTLEAAAVTTSANTVEAKDEIEKLRSFYEAAALKEREKYKPIREEIAKVDKPDNWRTLLGNNSKLQAVNEQLREIESDWQLLPEAQRKWVQELRANKEAIKELADTSMKLYRAEGEMRLLDAMMAKFNKAPADSGVEGVRSQSKKTRDAVALVKDVAKTPVDLGDFRKTQTEHIDEINKQLDEYEKQNVKKDNEDHKDDKNNADVKEPPVQTEGRTAGPHA